MAKSKTTIAVEKFTALAKRRGAVIQKRIDRALKTMPRTLNPKQKYFLLAEAEEHRKTRRQILALYKKDITGARLQRLAGQKRVLETDLSDLQSLFGSLDMLRFVRLGTAAVKKRAS